MDTQRGELLLACSPCRRTVTISYHPAHLAQGLVYLDPYRVCGYCGAQMEEAERGDCAHMLLPNEECSCIAAEQGRARRGPS